MIAIRERHDINDTTINIANGASTSHATGVLWSDLRPSIKLIKIIEAIETRYNAATYENPIVFSRDFFSTTEFAEQYLWLKADDREAIGGGEQELDFTSQTGLTTQNIDISTNTGTFVVTGGAGTYFYFSSEVTPTSGYENIPYTLIVRNIDTGVDIAAWNRDGDAHGDGRINKPIVLRDNGTYNLKWFVQSNAKIEFTSKVEYKQIYKFRSRL